MDKYLVFKRGLSDQWRLGKKYFLLFVLQQIAVKSIPFMGFIYMPRIVDA